jgi:hypothetical protein
MKVALRKLLGLLPCSAQSFSFHRELQLITSNLLEMGEIKEKEANLHVDRRITGKMWK